MYMYTTIHKYADLCQADCMIDWFVHLSQVDFLATFVLLSPI